MKHMIVSAALIMLLMTSCSQKIDLEAEKMAVKNVLDKMQQTMETEDMEGFASLIAHDADMVNFGTDETERWVGWDTMRSSMEQQNAAFDNMHIAVRDQVIKVAASGNAAWFSQVVDWSIETGGQQVNLEGARSTGVLEKRAGKWLLVQLHFSVGVAGQAAEY